MVEINGKNPKGTYTKRVWELSLYTPKVKKEELKRIFISITKLKTPFLGFLDSSSIYSKSPELIITKTGGVFGFYMKIQNNGLSRVGPLLFPFRLGKKVDLELKEPYKFSIPKIYPVLFEDILGFMLKGDIKYVKVRVRRVLGMLWASGTGVTGDLKKITFFSPVATDFFSLDFERHPSVSVDLLEPIPKRIATESDEPLFEEDDISIGLDNFDPIQHTLVAGGSGSGKTVFMLLYLKRIVEKYGKEVNVVIIDPHGEFARKYSGKKKVINFKDSYIEPIRSSKEYSPMLTQLITQLITSSMGKENKYAERVVFHSVHLLSSINKLELKNISKLLTDETSRMEYIIETEVDEVKDFFDKEFSDIYIHHFNDAILPVLNFISEYNLYLGNIKEALDLKSVIEENPVTIISFNPNFFGKKMIKFLGSSIINQMYILAITGKIKKKTILMIDEFPRVEAMVMKDILSETRKYNLYTILAAQYLGQLDKKILNALIGNMRNIIAFKLHRNDADMLGGMMEIKMEEYFKKTFSSSELEIKKKELFVRLSQRECIVRLFDGQKYLLPVKVSVVDVFKTGEIAI